jgi:hypothetical protein
LTDRARLREVGTEGPHHRPNAAALTGLEALSSAVNQALSKFAIHFPSIVLTRCGIQLRFDGSNGYDSLKSRSLFCGGFLH